MPFDRRFSGILLSSPTPSSQNLSVTYRPSHSRGSSLASTVIPKQDESDTPQPPWEVVRWTKLKRISSQVFTEAGKRTYGQPTVMVIGASIVLGTSKGLALIYDYHQNLVATIGLGTKAVESGAVTSLAISADHTTVAVGHATGHIFTWELSRPAKPFLHILPMTESQVEQRKTDGHVSGSAVVHVGFLGTRHTALVSADNRGMAFSHLATRGFGAVARAVKTARVLGRYPAPKDSKEKARKPSSVLGFASLPLGNVEHPTDALGLTALLTPYLLVVVSTTPIAETQFKAPRPKEIPPHSTLSGCLAWFPAVKLKTPDPKTGETISQTKLAYCWSHILTILTVEAETFEEKDKPPILHFQPRSRWRSQEPIVAVQWLSRSVIGILTISQRLVILEDNTLRVTDSFDLLQKHIYHQDIFSSQLRPVVEHLDDEDDSMHGVVADAFFMSFRTYKGRIFLLGSNDISIGTLSNWADRLMALLEGGDYIEAIRLAESYYTGASDKITVGLPEDDKLRHLIVQDKLIEMLSASLKYVLSDSYSQNGEVTVSKERLYDDLASASFSACLAMENLDFLFDDVFESFKAANAEAIFCQTLEPYILSEEISSIPTEVLKDMVMHYDSEDKAHQLENIICHLDARMMDINETTSLCKRYHLYDGFIHIWNQALEDYITPLIELLGLVKSILANPDGDPLQEDWAQKIFPYLAHTLIGKAYPSGLEMNDEDAFKAQVDLYGFVFAPKVIEWPPGSQTNFQTIDSEADEPQYPYLTLILRFDAASFLSMLHEAFEDPFLNGSSTDSTENTTNGVHHTKRLPTRQTIISILLDVMGDGKFDSESTIYLDMFIARNLPKFPQFIGLPGQIIDKIIHRLCDYPSEELADDCQLSVEYLLSYYHPSEVAKLTPEFRKAGFFRVLKSMYKGSRLYSKLLQAYFEDYNDREAVFDCIGDCLRPSSDLSTKQRQEVYTVITQNSKELVSINTTRAAQTLQIYAPQLLEPVLDSLEDGSYARFLFLKTLLESPESSETDPNLDQSIHHQFDEQYVRLMCAYEPSRVASYIDVLKSGDLRLQEVLPAIESSGAIDAAVVLLSRDGLTKDAMDRLRNHMKTLGIGLVGMINGFTASPDIGNTTEGVEDLLNDVQKYAKVGMWLCQGQTKAAPAASNKEKQATRRKSSSVASEDNLSLDEFLWLELVDAIVQLTKEASSASSALQIPEHFEPTMSKITTSLRSAVQECFTALLNATTRPTLPSDTLTVPTTQPHPSFLIILRAFLTRAASASPSLSDLRAVLAEIFQAYAFEARILDLANQFLDKDLFTHVEDAWTRRQKGWRPRGNVCEFCGKRIWGPGVGSGVWEQWEANMNHLERNRGLRRAKAVADVAAVAGTDRGKGKAQTVRQGGEEVETLVQSDADVDDDDEEGERRKALVRPLVLFACRHIWHKDCLERAMEREGLQHEERREFRCPAEHADGDK
jgi:vacuolar protein sorting-associated protein 8